MKAVMSVLAAGFFLMAASCHRGALREPTPSPKGTQAAEWFSEFLGRYERQVAPLVEANNIAYWLATTTGQQDAYRMNERLEYAIRLLHSDRKTFEKIQSLRKQGALLPALQRRQLALLWAAFIENQLDAATAKRLVELSNSIQKRFNTYRATIGGKVVNDAGIMDILKNSTDSERRRQAWEGYKKRGALVRDELLELVHLRNRAARKLGFSDYYSMRLRLQEQDPQEIERIFDELERQTTEPFAREMKKLRAALAKKFGIAASDLKPWHFSDPFFQEVPAASGLDLDRLFAKTDPVKLAEGFYSGIGLDMSDVLKRSDLWPREGKMPHAYCIDMNRAGDVRILANLTRTETQMSTLLHELGHAAYSKYISPELPWLLREESHPFTTEAIAMLFGRLTRNPGWLAGMGLASKEEASELARAFRSQLRLSMLIMARWTMVMVNFERELYKNPDQDLNTLWWRLKKRLQLMDPPPRPEGAADWASKIHVAAWPAYYHNYMLGELMASQLTYAMAKEQGTMPEGLRWVGNTRIGSWLKQKIFAPGKSLRWDDLLVKATGEGLNPSYFVRQFVQGG